MGCNTTWLVPACENIPVLPPLSLPLVGDIAAKGWLDWCQRAESSVAPIPPLLKGRTLIARLVGWCLGGDIAARAG